MSTEVVPDRDHARDSASAWLAAIVDHSQDAILSKTLDGVITSWNGGAERLFGYARSEAVGQPITIIIPDDRLHEEETIIARLRAGERVDRMETIRRTKDGLPVHIEVSISPVRDADGAIIGASKIARDIGERRRHAEEQALLLREMHHRIKNLLSIVQALVSVGRRRADNVDSFAEELTGRISTLANAQQLVLSHERPEGGPATLRTVLDALLAPYDDERVALPDGNCAVGPQAMTSLALIIHELATNAAKYGALSHAGGRLDILVEEVGDRVKLSWCETGGDAPDDSRVGFGSDLIRAALRGLRGTMARDWDGVRLTLRLDLDRSALAG